jgi:DNA-binding NtrC family response regulator
MNTRGDTPLLRRPPETAGSPLRQDHEAYRVVTVLSVSASADDHVHLRSLFNRTNWVLLEAHSCHEAQAMLRRQPIPVILCEPVLPDGTWQDLLYPPEANSGVPCLIVASRFADEKMWMEVLDRGGFNVLEKPFEIGELFRCISLAWLQWRDQNASTRQVSAAAG